MSYIDPSNSSKSAHEAYLDDLTKQIRHLQRIRLQYKKKVQDHCLHYNVRQEYKMPKVSLKSVLASDAVDYKPLKVKVICKDCGKVLNGRRR